MNLYVYPKRSFYGEITPPPDKSMSIRAVLFGGLGNGVSFVKNFLKSQDTQSALSCIRALGIEISEEGDGLKIWGRGLKGLKEPEDVLMCGNSGTTMRILSGILAAQPFYSVLSGDSSLNSRPMKRIVEPLRLMGAKIWGRERDCEVLPPLSIRGGNLKGIEYSLPMPSAQVKSCIIASALQVDGETIIEEPVVSRDHTERMVETMGGQIYREGKRIFIKGGQELRPFSVYIPGDFSSASFIIASALLMENAKIELKGVGVNRTRVGFLSVLKRMGANVKVRNLRVNAFGEPYADIMAQTSSLQGIEVGKDMIPLLIDEVPLLAIVGVFAHGKTVVRGAEELKYKESNRLKSVAENLRKLGIKIELFEDGFAIEGPQRIKGGVVDSFGDHRIAMAFGVVALASSEGILIQNAQASDVSYPNFWSLPLFK